jgi:hypothetical protein
MTKEEIKAVYEKEREYQKSVFGDYRDIPALNLSSFLLFIESSLQKAKKNYVSKWSTDLPPWLLTTSEFKSQNSAPVDTYAELIKIFALAGAALESYAAIDTTKWREEGIKNKWLE